MLITPRERLEALRRELFKRCTPQECFIAKETEVRGGFAFELHFPRARSLNWVEVKHWDLDRYWLSASFNTEERPLARYTRFSSVFPFEQIERQFLGLIGLLLKERG